MVAPGLKVKVVCAGCNNGWMSDLENRAKAIVEPLIDETTTLIDSEGRLILAEWAVKTSMVFEALRSSGPYVFTEEERTLIRQSRGLPRFTTVWIAKCVGSSGPYCSASDLGGTVVGSDVDASAYVTTMAFGPLAIQVLRASVPGADSAKSITADIRPGPWNDVAIRVWPTSRVAPWPPRVALAGDEGLEAFAERWSPIRS